METPIYKRMFNYDEVDVALCVADHLSSLMNKPEVGGSVHWSHILSNHGFAEMREQMMSMAIVIEAIHEEARKIDENYNDGIAFDYEVVPYLVERFRDGFVLRIQNDETFIRNEAVIMLTRLRVCGELTD